MNNGIVSVFILLPHTGAYSGFFYGANFWCAFFRIPFKLLAPHSASPSHPSPHSLNLSKKGYFSVLYFLSFVKKNTNNWLDGNNNDKQLQSISLNVLRTWSYLIYFLSLLLGMLHSWEHDHPCPTPKPKKIFSVDFPK